MLDGDHVGVRTRLQGSKLRWNIADVAAANAQLAALNRMGNDVADWSPSSTVTLDELTRRAQKLVADIDDLVATAPKRGP